MLGNVARPVRRGADGKVPGNGQLASSLPYTRDRFHVLKNLTEAVERAVSRHHTALRAAAVPTDVPASPPAAPSPTSVPEAPGRSPTKAQQDREARRARRQARYDEVIALHEHGYSQNQIACALGMGRHTIRRFLRAAGFRERAAP